MFRKLFGKILNETEKTDEKYYNKHPNSTALSTRNIANANTSQNAYESTNKEWVHDSEILRNKWTDPNNPIAREGMSLFQEFGKANIYKVADAITRIPITFTQHRVYKKNEEPEEHKAANLFWVKMNLQAMLTQAIIDSRNHGIVVYTNNTRKSRYAWESEPIWKLITPLNITVINTNKGVPLDIQGKEQRYLDQIDINLQPNEYIICDPNETKDCMGIPSNWAIWNKLLSLECIGSSIEIFLERLGNGFLHADLPAGTPESIRTTVKNTIKHLRSELGVYTESDGQNKATMNWVAPSISGTFDTTLNQLKNDIAVGAEFPLEWFTNPSTETIQGAVLHRLTEIAHKYDKFIKAVLIFHGIIENFSEVDIDYHIGQATLDLEKNQAAIAANSVIAAKTWLTIDERRKLDGYEPLPNAEGASINPMGKTDRVNTTNDPDKPSFPGVEGTKPDQFERKQLASETRMEQAKEKPKEQKTDTKSLLKAMSERELAELLGLSPSTCHKIKDTLAVENKEYAIKTDSFQRVGNKVHFDHAVILAPHDNLEYEDHIEIQSKDEIRAWYSSEVPKEFYLGVQFAPDHNGSIEVSRSLSVGIIKADSIDEKGFVYGSGTIDLDKVDAILGADNYVHEQIKTKKINLSAGVKVKEEFVDDRTIKRTKLDLRSIMIVPEGRNPNTSIKADAGLIRGKNVVYAGKELGQKAGKNIDVMPVSSNVREIKWFADTKILTVWFMDGSIYDYNMSAIPNYDEVVSLVTKGMASATTEGEANGVRWWVGKNPSFGAAVHEYLSTGMIPYTSR